MKRTGVAFLAATVALIGATAAMAAPVNTSLTVSNGWNLISLPTVPLDPDPLTVFSSIGGESAIDGKLIRYDPVLRSNLTWDPFSDEFGNMLLGDGYWLFRQEAGSASFTYTGVDVSGDHWLSLPRAGWTLLGYPNNTPATLPFENLLVTNGIETKSITDAINAGWISDSAITYNTAFKSNETVGIPDAFPDLENLESGRGYWFFTNVNNLALIVPGS